MDAQSIELGEKRRTRMDHMKFSGEVQQLRSDMLEVEDKIVEDIDRLKGLLTPDRVANYIFLMIWEELFTRVKTIDWPKFEEVSNEAQKFIKDHKLMSGILGVGVSGLLFYALLMYSRSDYPPRRIEVTGIAEAKDPQIFN